MKEKGSLIVAFIIGLAIIISLHKDGKLFTSVKSVRSTPSKTASAHVSGEVKGVQTNEFQATSPYKNNVTISDVVDPGRFVGLEYLTLRSSSNDPVTLTGWRITSNITGNSITIGNASPLPGTYPEQPIVLTRGDKVIISTDKSPVDISFRVNQCTGYFEDHNMFIPKLQLQCPDPEHEDNMPKKVEDNETCMDYLDDFSICELPPKKLPNLSSSCKTYIEETISYNGCVALHKNDKKFLKPEWRIFAGSKFPLFLKEHDVLMLWDAQGRLVDTFEYENDED